MKNSIDMRVLAGKLMVPLVMCTFSLKSQTLFTCDGRGVSKEEFLKAYSKNSSGERPTEKSYRDYLELYIRYKLKVRAAYDMQLDSLPTQRVELQNFRNQVADSYLKDEASLDKLVSEAFTRGQKDIHIEHIYISIPPGSAMDTARAYDKAWMAYNELKRGKKFSEAAAQYSEDPAAKRNGGDLGYITVFSLPYELETLAYTTMVGGISKPYRSKGGYHIFRNLGERKSLGKMKAAQILVAVGPDATPSVRDAARQKADSIYGALQKGADFGALARMFSGDNLSYQSGGEIAEFGVGRYDPAFEAAAFALDRDGAITRPVATSYGYHIIKRLGRMPFPTLPTEAMVTALKQEINSDARADVSRQVLLKKIYQQTGMRKSDFPEADLWAFTDSIMTNPGLNAYKSLSYNTVLLTFPSQQYTVQHWLDYARIVKGARGRVNNASLFSQFTGRVAMDYYRDHLEDYDKDFAFQLTEFKEGNLLFEVMQRKIWEKASTDSAGLHKFYEAHRDRYWWESSVDALLFTCSDEPSAQQLRSHLSSDVSDWRRWSDSARTGVQADSGRYETAQIPALEHITVYPRQFTPFVTSKSDGSVSFAYIIEVYQNRMPRNYRDARGFVINDFQTWMEEEWIASLKKKYPIAIDEKVFATLPK